MCPVTNADSRITLKEDGRSCMEIFVFDRTEIHDFHFQNWTFYSFAIAILPVRFVLRDQFDDFIIHKDC